MFRKTDTNPQLDLFTAPCNILPKRAQRKYTDEKAWHNQFFKLVTSQTVINLMERCFEQVTGEQIKLFKISGNSVRMDSKFIGSNIAQYSRYELIHRTLCKVLRQDGIMMMLHPKHRKSAEIAVCG